MSAHLVTEELQHTSSTAVRGEGRGQGREGRGQGREGTGEGGEGREWRGGEGTGMGGEGTGRGGREWRGGERGRGVLDGLLMCLQLIVVLLLDCVAHTWLN